MYIVFLAGGIASGKSFVASEFERQGALRIDLDAISREVLSPRHPCVEALTARFGHDLIDAKTGELSRALLAERAFASAETAQELEAIEHPFIMDELTHKLCVAQEAGEKLCVVEVPLLDRIEESHALADEIVAVLCPFELRRERAEARGMDAADFEARAALQPSDEYLEAHADTIFENSGTKEDVESFVSGWLSEHTKKDLW